MNVLSLFSGVGGIDLGLERAGMRVVAQCEIDPFCRAVLAKHWPDVPKFTDVRELHASDVSRVDLVAGGFPCQDVSAAGKGAGIGGARSGLWREMARLIAECRPAWVLVENVPALRTRGADRVLADLEAIGYDAWPLVVGAWAVGAPHKRHRVWIVAHADRGRLEGERIAHRQPGDEGASGRVADGRNGEAVADADARGLRADGSAAAGRPDADESSADMADRDSDSVREQPRRECGTRWAGAAELGGGGEGVADADRAGLEKHGRDVAVRPELAPAECGGLDDSASSGLQTGRPAGALGRLDARSTGAWPSGPGEPQHDWEEPRLVEFGVGSAAPRLPGGLVRLARRANREALKAYGNAVVPQVVEAIGRAIMKEEAKP